MFTTRVSLHHTTIFTNSHANTPLGQSECTYYLSYFIKGYREKRTTYPTPITFLDHVI